MSFDKIQTARVLRKGATEAEKVIWEKLRRKNIKGLKFRRQHPVGKYIVDFICLEKKLIVEIDGGQHSGNKEDLVRDEWLKREGYKVVRIWNHEALKNTDAVLEFIYGMC